MKKMILLGITLGVSMPCHAIPYQGQTIYRSTNKGENILIISGPANTKKEFYVPQTAQRYRYRGTDACNWTQINLPPVPVSNFTANGIPKNPYTAPTFNRSYSCSDWYGPNIGGSEGYNAATRTYYFRGSGANQAITFAWTQPGLRRATINDCGFAEIDLSRLDLSSIITMEGTNYTLNALPVAPYPPMCRIVNGVRVPYVAQ